MTNQTIQGFSGLITLLAALGLVLQWVANARSEQRQRVDSYRSELRVVDNEVQRTDESISLQSEALDEVESFYSAWLPEIIKCEDSDALISTMIVEAYALNLILVKKGVKYGEPIDYRGRSGSTDRIELTVSGRYDRLIRYLDRIRSTYPFLVTEKITFAVNDASVELTLTLSSCQLNIPDSERPSEGTNEVASGLQWVELFDEEGDS